MRNFTLSVSGKKPVSGQINLNDNVPPPPIDYSDISSVKRAGRIATLVTDPFSPYWGFTPRRPSEALAAWPQTSRFNHIPSYGKGKRLPMTQHVLDATVRLNGQRNADRLYIGSTGWINSDGESPLVDKVSPTSERLSWSANHVIVLEQRDLFSRVYAHDCNTPINDTFFSKDGRLVVHEFNAIRKDGAMVKFGSGILLYTPFTTDGEMWCATEELFFWPSLPFLLGDGTYITEYELQGFEYYGIRVDGTRVLLRDGTGFKTNWSIPIPEVPI